MAAYKPKFHDPDVRVVQSGVMTETLILGDHSGETSAGMVLGSPSYMSPEQLAGNKIGGASDLFSLGVSMYQLLCGKLPFYGDSMAQLMCLPAWQLSSTRHWLKM